MNPQDVVALVVAVTALVGAIVALVRELRGFRQDVVAAVDRHTDATLLHEHGGLGVDDQADQDRPHPLDGASEAR